jgi:HPt (histidine-containing phosphotransfer) domain-containing protein
MIDVSILEELKSFAGVEACAAILEAFWDGADDLVAAMQAAHAAGDLEGLGRAAHSLKGSALNVGANEAAEIARSLERPGPNAGEELARLRLVLGQTRPLLDRALLAA